MFSQNLNIPKSISECIPGYFLIWGSTTKINLILPKFSQSMSHIQVFTLTSVELANK